MGLGKLDIHMQMKMVPYFIAYANSNAKWIKDPNIDLKL